MPFFKGHKYNIGRACSEETRAKIRAATEKPKVALVCETCSKEFEVWLSLKNRKFCGRECSRLAQIGKPSWNKGLLGFRAGERHDWMPKGEKHWSYKGDKVQYRSLHQWMVNNYGQPDTCEHCCKKAVGHNMHWANVSDEYKRDRDDWKRLCATCHGQFDKEKRQVKKSIC